MNNIKIDELNKVSWESRDLDSNKSRNLALKSLEQSIANDYTLGKHTSNITICYLDIKKNIYNLYSIVNSYNHFKDINKNLYCRASYVIGLLYFYKDNNEYLQYLVHGLILSEDIEENDLTVSILSFLGEIYKENLFFKKSINYFNKAINIAYSYRKSEILTGLAYCYDKTNSMELSRKTLSKSVINAEQHNNDYSKEYAYRVLSEFYLSDNNYKSASFYNKKALKLSIDHNINSYIAFNYLIKSEIQLKTKLYDESIISTDLANEQILAYKLFKLSPNAYRLLSEANFQLCNFTLANEYSDKSLLANNTNDYNIKNSRLSLELAESKLETFFKNEELINLKNKFNNTTLLLDISDKMLSFVDFSKLMDFVYEKINDFTNTYYFAIGIINENSEYNFINADSKHYNSINIKLNDTINYGVESILNKKSIYSVKGMPFKESHIIPNQNENLTKSFIFTPIFNNNIVIGCLTIQSKFENEYDMETVKIIEDLSIIINIAMDNFSKVEIIKNHSDDLKVVDSNLEVIEKKLIEANKLAELGELISGVIQELYTPLEHSTDLIKNIQKNISILKSMLTTNKLKKSNLLEFINSNSIALDHVNDSINQTNKIINSVKAIAITKSELVKKRFYLKSYLDDFIFDATETLNLNDVDIDISCSDEIVINSYPTVISLILNQFISNSIDHGFKFKNSGRINIDIKEEKDNLILLYSDDGSGLSSETLEHIFDPFFTTNKADGYMGVGLSGIQNMITEILNGNLFVESSIKGTTFKVSFTNIN